MSTSSLKMLGRYPTPYGVEIPVYENPDNQDDYLHDVDGSMTLAGIHSAIDRSRCKAALSEAMGGNVRFQIFMDHGGRQVPRLPLPRPGKPIYPNLPRTHVWRNRWKTGLRWHRISVAGQTVRPGC